MSVIKNYKDWSRINEAAESGISGITNFSKYNNDHVMAAQNAMKADNIKVTADGRWGPKTQLAVKEFQTKHKLTSDGIIGANTLTVLKSTNHSRNHRTIEKDNVVTTLPFKTKKEGDAFRQWVNKEYPEYAKREDLDATGSFNNIHITRAWKAYGSRYTLITTAKSKYTSLLVSDSLLNKNIKFDLTVETTPFTCTEEGCAEWVSNSLKPLGVIRQGHAWHSMLVQDNMLEFSALIKLSSDVQSKMAALFTKLNKAPREASQESAAKEILASLIPDQNKLKSTLNVNDIVGLYYARSSNFTKAFFEGGTGYYDMGSGKKATSGPFFIRKDTKEAWSQADLNQDIEFIPGKTLQAGGGFGTNTHLGFVGAIVDGEPLIFHNIHQNVHSTPLSKMKDIKIMWVKATDGSFTETTIEKYLKKVKDTDGSFTETTIEKYLKKVKDIYGNFIDA